MDINDLKRIIQEGNEKNLSIKIRDIFFVMLRHKVSDDSVCYSALYGTDFEEAELESYIGSEKISFLNKLLAPTAKNAKGNTITFDENRAGMEEDLRYIDKFIKKNEKDLDPKEIAALMGKKSDLRVKLNDKFGVSEQKDEQRIIVMTKFSGICDWTHRECPMTKEYAKQKFNLIENKR